VEDSFPCPRSERPPPRRPLELIMEAEGRAVPSWIVQRMNATGSAPPPPFPPTHPHAKSHPTPAVPVPRQGARGAWADPLALGLARSMGPAETLASVGAGVGVDLGLGMSAFEVSGRDHDRLMVLSSSERSGAEMASSSRSRYHPPPGPPASPFEMTRVAPPLMMTMPTEHAHAPSALVDMEPTRPAPRATAVRPQDKGTHKPSQAKPTDAHAKARQDPRGGEGDSRPSGPVTALARPSAEVPGVGRPGPGAQGGGFLHEGGRGRGRVEKEEDLSDDDDDDDEEEEEEKERGRAEAVEQEEEEEEDEDLLEAKLRSWAAEKRQFVQAREELTALRGRTGDRDEARIAELERTLEVRRRMMSRSLSAGSPPPS
jgi:hypothetical protein